MTGIEDTVSAVLAALLKSIDVWQSHDHCQVVTNQMLKILHNTLMSEVCHVLGFFYPFNNIYMISIF